MIRESNFVYWLLTIWVVATLTHHFSTNQNKTNTTNNMSVFRQGPPVGLSPNTYDKIKETQAMLGAENESTVVFIACTALQMLIKKDPDFREALKPEVEILDSLHKRMVRRCQTNGPAE